MVERDLRKLVWGEKRKTRKKIPKGVRESVWNKYIGKEKVEGKCYVCNRKIRITNFEVGHNKAVVKGGSDRITNLRPICRRCNSSMGTMSIETYKKKYYSKSKKKTTKKTKKAKKKRRTQRKTTALDKLSKKIEKDFL